MSRFSYLLFLIFSLASVQASADDWLQWRGPLGNGVAPSQSPPVEWGDELNIVWQSKVPGRGHSSPIVIGDRIFLTTADELEKTQSVLCFNRKNGQRVWEKVIHTGKFARRIHQKNTHASPTIASDGESLFAFFNNDGSVHLTKMKLDGTISWQKKAGQFKPYYPFGFAASPTVWKDWVIVCAESEKVGFLCAFDKKNGNEVWRTDRMKTSYSSPIVAKVKGKSQLLLSGGNKVSGYDPQSGKQLWSAPSIWQVSCGTLVWDSDRVFASGGFPRAQTLCVKADGSGEIVWQNRVKCYEQSMLYHDGYLYGISDNGIGYCWDAKDGSEKWKHRMQGPVSCSPILAGGNIYFTSERGLTFVVRANPEKYEQVRSNRLGNSAFATPAFCNNQIYSRVAKDENGRRQEYLICIGKKEVK